MQKFKRQPTRKINIENLTSGKLVEKNGGKFLETVYGEEISRARIIATVVGKFISEDKNFASVTIDDGTDTIRVKLWQDISLLENIEVGQLVDIIGKVREYNDEIYLVPEIIQKIEDPNLELLRKLEVKNRLKQFGDGKSSTNAQKTEDTVREDVVKMIEENKEGIEYTKILEAFPEKKQEVESVIDDLLSGGICYEPNPGKIKKI